MKNYILIVFLSGFISTANAGFDEGLMAHEAGNYKQAFESFMPLAKQGDAQAQFNIGVMYDEGQGVRQDNTQANVWYRKAAEQGHVVGQRIMGFQYFHGRGVPRDYVQAFSWYRKAAEQGDASAQGSIGLMYEVGLGVTKDDILSVKWLRMGAERGEHFAQFALGKRYAQGEGVPKNKVVAYALFNLFDSDELDALPNGHKQKLQTMQDLTRETYKDAVQLTSEMTKPNNLNKAIAKYLNKPN
ncbi:tetratricopeptide repeat protein [Iodobacter sp. LRB]|uniref:tetratricopeptide repeat protein n=1 Tax=unclassified Iodobacter TaxID=235634 RepID=UPI000C0E6220|nr:tetratricopeptide repeat protein [Iodobacter sp. BJB302]PHV00951.1 hypothetical protein CSQ88_14795 [Iodobacter sp. BJB302]